MAKEILIYGGIYCDSASEFIEDINEAETQDITLRVNSDGGEVRYGWGVVARFSELTGKKLVKNDGEANSMAAFLFCYADDAEAIDTATFGLHRAAYAPWIESNPDYFTDDDKAALAFKNKKLRAALEAKIDVEKFNALGRGTIDEMFSMDGRKEFALTAKEAKDVGLINRVVTITPKKKAEINAAFERITAKKSDHKIAATQTQTQTKMTKAEFKAANPEVYAEILAEGKNEMKEVAQVWAHFLPVDAKAASDGIKSGLAPTPLQIVELTTKMASAVHLRNIGAENAESTHTGETGSADATLTAEQKNSKQAEAEFDKTFEALRKTNKIV